MKYQSVQAFCSGWRRGRDGGRWRERRDGDDCEQHTEEAEEADVADVVEHGEMGDEDDGEVEEAAPFIGLATVLAADEPPPGLLCRWAPTCEAEAVAAVATVAAADAGESPCWFW